MTAEILVPSNGRLEQTYIKVPLEERLRRIEAGNTPSPQFSRSLIDTFCWTPVLSVLNELQTFEACKQLLDLMKDAAVRELCPEKCTSDPTFGDLASLIREYCWAYGTRLPDKEKLLHLYRGVLQLATIYFTCFDIITCAAQKASDRRVPLLRDSLKPAFRPVYDFLYVFFDEYYDYTARCDIYGKYTKKIDAHLAETGLPSSTHQITLYNYLKWAADCGWVPTELCCERQAFTEEDEQPLDLEHLTHLIDFFVSPVALITQRGRKANISILKEAMQNEKQRNEKQP